MGDAAGHWIERQERLRRLATCQLFFVGGAPRSGTTWLQQLLDAHLEVSCRGEDLFARRIADPLDALTASWRAAVAGKNGGLSGHSGGYPEPTGAEADHLLGTAVLLAPDRQREGRECHAVGEKTPENVTNGALHADAAAVASDLFGFLSVSAEERLLARCVDETSFAVLSRKGRGGRADALFPRKGQAGDRRSTCTPEMGAAIMSEPGWMFPAFGWVP